jgi:peptidoglycan/LPS O-acetylase OafA/YrhL
LVLMLALVEKRGQALHWFSSPIIILGGEISYSFYLIHNLILRYLKHGLQILFHLDIRFCPLGGQLGIATVALILSLASSLILYRYVETPCRRIIRQFL